MSPSSDRDADKESQAPQQPSENPFIKFRQFADAQISSLLQGIIGLPSAFSKNPAGNARWTHFDDELRRRDELQARQKALKDSEAQRSTGSTVEEVSVPVKKHPVWGSTVGQDGSIPVKKSPDWDSSSAAGPGTSATTRQIDNGELEEPELYSPLMKLLFTHLNQTPADLVEWKRPCCIIEGFPKNNPLFYAHYEPYILRQDQRSPDILKMIQFMMYNHLNQTAEVADAMNPVFWKHSVHSGATLLPYLLFSPYSPLKLDRGLQSSASIRTSRSPPDLFPYCDAFEDLIKNHHGLPSKDSEQIFTLNRVSPLGDDVSIAKAGMSWVSRLGYSGLLWPPQAPRQIPHQSTSMSFQRSTESMNTGAEDSPKEPKTEQEMYDRFLRAVSSPSSTSTGIVQSLFADAERFVEDQVKVMEKQGGNKELKEPSKQEVAPKQISDASRVVSTMTSSEHTTHEDGTVETTLSVRKVFADGRETLTETTYTKILSDEDETTEPLTKLMPEREQPQQVKKPETKKGWFWN